MKNEPKLLLINVMDKEYVRNFYSPLNLVCLASYLTKNKKLNRKNIRIINSGIDNVQKILNSFQPNIIGFSTVTPFYQKTLNLAKIIRKKSKALLIIGGYHISALPKSLEKPFDMGVIGEGEDTLSLIIEIWKNNKIKDDDNLLKIPNLVYFNNSGKLILNDTRKVMDVEKLTKTDWKLIPKNLIVNNIALPINGKYRLKKLTLFYTARGCPYNCAFCAHRVMTLNEKGVRFFPLEQVLDEMKYLYHHYKVDCFQVLDDTFTVSKERVKLMIDGLKKRKMLGKICFFNIFVRANTIDPEFSKLLKDLGVITVFIGVESGSKKILKKLKDGPADPKIVEMAIDNLGKFNVYVIASFMLFSPNETKNDFEKSIKLAELLVKKNNLFSLSISATTPYPGTKLWSEAIESGIIDIKKPNWEDFLMLHLDNNKKMPKIFYNPSWADKKEIKKLWTKFINISKKASSKLKKINGLNEVNIKIEKINKSNTAFLNISKRWKRIILDPKKILKLFTKPEIIKLTIKDIKTFFSKNSV